jgi:hypothetical protein
VLTVVCADFRNREEELKNALATSRSNVRDLEVKVREIEARGSGTQTGNERSHRQ